MLSVELLDAVNG
jgi:hypothetical protein